MVYQKELQLLTLAQNAKGGKLGVMDANHVDNVWDAGLQSHATMTNIDRG
jgi:hypothetical protein